MFTGRKLVIATKHGKESVIAPLAEQGLGVKCFVPPSFDTDVLGTFTGEIERADDPITTVHKKCNLAMEQSDCDMAIATEGSFGPHPSLLFIPAHDEIILFVDKRNEVVIMERELSTDTNFSGASIRDLNQLKSFAKAARFPEHGLIVRRTKEDLREIRKGITGWDELKDSVDYFISKYGAAYIETDMRAMFNPSRMRVIERVAQKLVARINSVCPECSFPGFGVSEAIRGLPCKLCKSPTRSVLSHRYTCQKCGFSHDKMYPNNALAEEPMYCDNCNP